MQNSRLSKRIVGFFAALAVMTTATLALACPGYRCRVTNARVNTAVERRFDYDHNGWIGPGERWALLRSRVNHSQEYRCDFNRNGWVDTRSERACL